MKKRYLLLLSFAGYLYASEPSAFSAGDLDSENPYGLTESEKALVHNKKLTEENRKKINTLSFQVNEVKENIEGLRTVVDSISMKVGQTDQQLIQIKSTNEENSSNELEQVKNELNELKKVQEQNYKKIERVLKELSSLIDSINNAYVSKEEFEKELKKKVIKKPQTGYKEVIKDNAALYSEATSLYRSKHYDDAVPLFQKLVANQYKPGLSNYYLGEIHYYKKSYQDAIVFYKKSIAVSDTASYVSTLLLHTGISFERINEVENARKFYAVLIEKFPGSKQAKFAQKYMTRLNQ